jgi:hypothetical protein
MIWQEGSPPSAHTWSMESREHVTGFLPGCHLDLASRISKWKTLGNVKNVGSDCITHESSSVRSGATGFGNRFRALGDYELDGRSLVPGCDARCRICSSSKCP